MKETSKNAKSCTKEFTDRDGIKLDLYSPTEIENKPNDFCGIWQDKKELRNKRDIELYVRTLRKRRTF